VGRKSGDELVYDEFVIYEYEIARMGLERRRYTGILHTLFGTK